MNKLFAGLTILLTTYLLSGPALAEGDFIGSIKKVAGQASITRQDKTIPAEVGGKLKENDILRTGPDSGMGVIFRDDTTLSLGPESELTVDKFVFAPAKGKLGLVTRMLKGTAAYVSGKIAELAPKSVRFETPLATIGIRGTRFLVQVED